MVTIRQIDTTKKREVKDFVQFPFSIYRENPYWVPPILLDVETALNPEKHPFYEHSEADFFVAEQGGEIVGRIGALLNHPYNQYHDTRQAQFYYFDCINNLEAAKGLFERVFEWARKKGMNQLIGPKGFGALDGYGLLVKGFDQRQMMNMMNYNEPYYPALLEALGFTKLVDFVSCYLSPTKFTLPDRVHRIAERVLQRGNLEVLRFKNKSHLKQWAARIGKTYNEAFVDNWEYYPLSDREIKFLTDNIMTVADPKLIKIITHKDQAVGFLFGFPDISAAMQRSKGRLFPFGIVDLLLEMRRTRWIALNGAGILPKYHGRGGNAVLYSEMEKTIREYNFEHADLTQVADSAVQMQKDLVNLGGEPYKNHRVYSRDL